MRPIPLSAVSPRSFEKKHLGGCRFYRGRENIGLKSEIIWNWKNRLKQARFFSFYYPCSVFANPLFSILFYYLLCLNFWIFVFLKRSMLTYSFCFLCFAPLKRFTVILNTFIAFFFTLKPFFFCHSPYSYRDARKWNRLTLYSSYFRTLT